KSEPMSPSPAAPRSASTSACAITSPSEWPASPRGWASSTPPRTSGTPSTSACASTPTPTRTSATEEPRHALEVRRRRHLPQPFVACDHRDAAPGRLDELGAIRRTRHVVARGEGGAQYGRDERLRRLHRDERVAVEGLRDDAVREPLDRVDDGQAGDGAVEALAERLEQPVDDLRRQQGAGRVVHEHDGRFPGHL